jgi:pimeloyl-ACP methyl ester carboxylesterase
LISFAEAMDRQALEAEAALEQVDVRDLDPPAAQRLGEIAVPALVAAGGADIPQIRRLADHLGAEIPHARRLVDVPCTGHLLPLERPDLAGRALIDFLSEQNRT